MAVTMNGKRQPQTNNSPKGPKALSGVNGHGPAVSVTAQGSIPAKRRRGFFARSSGAIARLFTWYTILTLLFWCPSSPAEYNETSPKICKPYLYTKHAVAPHLTPYYDAYAAPYVELARPYYDTLDSKVITPGRAYAVKYGGPRVAQVQALGHAQWEKNLQPQILKYQTLAKAQYDQTISPHVDKAATAIAPYYDIARTNALQTYHEVIVPTYTFVHPYASQCYDVAYDLTRNTVLPSTVWAWNKTYAFLDSAVWPHLRDVYILKVEPQLVRIGERLGRYNEKKPKAVVEENESSAPKATFIKPTVSISSTTVSVAAPTQTPSQVPDIEYPQASEAPSDTQSTPSETPKSKQEVRDLAAKTVAEDLELWQNKFTKVAEEGAAEIEDRVDEISADMIENHANTIGKSLVSQLETTVHSELDSLKKAIVSILESGSNDSKMTDENVAAAVRSAGLNIKNKAQNIRDWRQSYEQQTEVAVTKAAEEHFSIIERTRDLALQKIGMKWAWMDGVTYKDWQKYHQLRARFEEWTDELKRLITTHPGLVEAQTAAINIEGEGMAIAHEAATELGRLKQVAAWKATAQDFTDDFDSSRMQLAAEAAEKRIAESVRLASEEAAQKDVDTSALPPMESLAGEPTDSSIELHSSSPTTRESESESQRFVNEPTNAAEPSEPLSSVDQVDGPEQMEETIIESPDLPIHTIDKEGASTTVKSVLFGAAAESVPTRQPILDDNVLSSASSALSVAQSDAPASITSAAQSAYTAALAGAADQYSRAMSAVSAQISGEPKPVHEEMLSSVSNGYFGAIAAANSRLNEAMTVASENIYGTPTTKRLPVMPTVPSVDWERVQSIAQQKFEDSMSWASDQYDSAKVAIGAAEPTPSTYLEGAEKRAEKLLDQAKHNYFAGVGLAHARYSEFLSVASTAVSSLTATPTPTNIQESASSAVSAASEAAESMASSVGDLAGEAKDVIDQSWDRLVSRVSSQVYGASTPTPWYENLYVAASDYASQAGDSAVSASEAVADQVAAASSLVEEYAASATSAASSQYVAVSSLVSELVIGKEPSYTESVYSRLAHAYTTGLSSASSIGSVASATAASAASIISDAASSGLEAASENIASATDKVKDTVDHIKDEL
ncbi:hypothetical protein F5B22DRAFT_582937 [Xylaria bambusicola]|uniref:uncharacterized protein n=1 Tax=Xylaria bambusicola TaxID=326684 RepID=UPI002007984C|nr:uncharacterized protein F5B22DRAFT_582937 [Xylaria bambusicola]KAI0527950.1 hypothetical protein F5B22DRAFT_582937 [Xylaria bambusicola]